ncbi:MAG TPA: TIGR03086 family metal-binding protein [Euzebya sp.]|nr:TIGR03086 family metal-binding protein [Euzebya sp.]
MTTTAATYRALADRFAHVAAALDPADWDRPSPCEGWTARDVLAHVMTTQHEFLIGTGTPLDGPTDVDPDPAGAWAAHVDAVASALADPTVSDASYEGMFGPSTVGATLLRFYGFDMIVHRWDVATAAGLDAPFSAAEMDHIEEDVAAFGPHLYGEGICGPPVEVAADASRQDRLLGALGRDPARQRAAAR